jgi:hypothetical protein
VRLELSIIGAMASKNRPGLRPGPKTPQAPRACARRDLRGVAFPLQVKEVKDLGGKRPSDTEAQVADLNTESVSAAEGRAEELGTVVPGTAADDTETTIS